MVKSRGKSPRGLTFEELCRYPMCVAMAKTHKLAFAMVPVRATVQK